MGGYSQRLNAYLVSGVCCWDLILDLFLTLKGALCTPCWPCQAYTVVHSGMPVHAVCVVTIPSGSPEKTVQQNDVSLPSSQGCGSKLPFTIETGR